MLKRFIRWALSPGSAAMWALTSALLILPHHGGEALRGTAGIFTTHLPSKYAFQRQGRALALSWSPGSIWPELCLLQAVAISPAL